MKKSKSKANMPRNKIAAQHKTGNLTSVNSQAEILPPTISVGIEDVDDKSFIDQSMNQEVISNNLGAGHPSHLQSHNEIPERGAIILPEIPQSNRHN
jgi:hypothetical protein